MPTLTRCAVYHGQWRAWCDGSRSPQSYDYSAKCHSPKKEGAKTLHFYLSKTRPSLQLVFELSWEYYLLDNKQYYKTTKTHHLSQLRISRKIKIKLIIHYYMEFFLSRFTGRGVQKRCAPPFRLHAALLAHTPPLHARGGALLPLSCPHFGAPTLPFACRSPPELHATLLAHPPPCTHTGVHRHPFAPLLWCAHPSIHPWLPCLGSSP